MRNLWSTISDISTAEKWLNANQGVVALLIFIFALIFGWTTGIFAALRRRPKLRIDLIEGPNFCCTFETGREHDGQKTHRTCFALYLRIRNVGAADTGIEEIYVGYRNRVIARRSRWFWIIRQTVALADFRVNIGGQLKVYPFLLQKNFLMENTGDAFIPVGRIATGIGYWEQGESYGGFFPQVDHQNQVQIKVRVIDAFGRGYTHRFHVPMVSLDDARKFLPEFGTTGETLKAAEAKAAELAAAPP